MLSDEHPEIDVLGPESRGGSTVALHIVLPDVDAVVARAVDNGAFLERPVDDQPYGERSGIIRDPFGHRWFVATPLETPTHAQVQERIGDRFELQRPPTSVGYFTVGTQDLARATAFYGSLFGWRVRVSGQGGHIENLAGPPGGIEQGGPPAKLYFRVDDADAMAVRVRELGGETDEPTSSPSGRGISCRDDQGTPFELWQPAPGY
jgi:predicted enzyme related to lactoylglutathione lyase